MKIEYDKPIEVNKLQYEKIMDQCSGIVAGMEDGGKYFIKVWFTKYSGYVEGLIKKYQQ